MYSLAAILVCALALQSGSASAVKCYSCANITNIPDCSTTVICPANSICSSEYTTVQGKRLYTLGCKSIWSCPAIPSTVSPTGVPSIIGRSATGTGNCSECCKTSHCNRERCQDEDPYCTDDRDRNCNSIANSFNICNDIVDAKLYCRRFCGFCNTIDGGWAAWTTWSSCDVTCANGTRTRVRACSDPAPANGGIDCAGETKLHEPCTKPKCPVHGGWTLWSEWGSCSVSCDIGLQRRDRTCSNPYPGPQGDHCFGESRDDRVCYPGACANGSWSSWGTWGSCDKTCNGGVRTRTRNCDNPTPSLTGKYCSGETTEAVSCNTTPCQGPVVFYAKRLYDTSPGHNKALRYTTVITNDGNAYNSTTGYFVAPVNGTYTFNVQFCYPQRQNVGVGLFINKVRYQNLQAYSYSTYGCRTLSVTVALKQGDTVHAEIDSNTSTGTVFYSNTNKINSFSGALVRL